MEARRDAGAAWDTARGRLVVFGGDTGDDAESAQTWEWDGTDWTPRSEDTGPPARYGAGMAYDAAHRQTVLFGGASFGVVRGFGDTWTWNGAVWEQRVVGPAPPARSQTAMAFDPQRQTVVLFGGSSLVSDLGDTWEWNGVSWNAWTGPSPSARSKHAMAWDEARSGIVMFGGRSQLTLLNDTWIWSSGAWTNVATGAGPSARYEHALAFEPSSQSVMLYGGFTTVPMNDVWLWNGSLWSRQSTGPAARGSHVLVSNPARQTVVALGGSTGAYLQNYRDLWEFDGTSWAERRQLEMPPGGFSSSLAYDWIRRATVHFVGAGGTWEHRDGLWTQRQPVHRPAGAASFLAYDLARGRTVLFSVPYWGPAETWEWDGVDWTQRATTGPSPRGGTAMSADLMRNVIVLFGGGSPAALNDTWEWDGVVWQQRQPASIPRRRFGHAMAYDLNRDQTVLIGGFNGTEYLPDTWEWDGTNWRRRTATAPFMMVPGAAFDIARQRVVAVSVIRGGGGLVFEWDGVAWTRIADATPARRGSAMAYDVSWRRSVVFGGAGDPTASSAAGNHETWYFGNLASAQATPAGAGCGNPSSQLVSNEPGLGMPALSLDLLSADAASPVIFGLATARQSTPIGSCTAWLGGDIAGFFHIANNSGFASLKIAVPAQPTLRGTVLYTQAFALGTSGLAFSNALQLQVGD
jgi:hypothetical protein